MAFVKLYKVVPDSPWGYQSANQTSDNAAELRTQMLVEHGGNDAALGAIKGVQHAVDYGDLGRHNLNEIPRAAGYAATFTASLLSVGVQLQWTGPGIPLIWRIGAGDYLLPVIGLSVFWAKASQSGGSTVTYLEPQVRPFYPTTANGYNSGLRVNTYRLDAGDFVPADMSFGIALYGTP